MLGRGRRSSPLLALQLSLLVLTLSSHVCALDVLQNGGLEILFPQPGQTLCDADQLELVAIFDGSPLLTDGCTAVMLLSRFMCANVPAR